MLRLDVKCIFVSLVLIKNKHYKENKIMTDQVWLRVPRELADKLDTIAKKKGITARGRWAVYARMVLIAHYAEERSS